MNESEKKEFIDLLNHSSSQKLASKQWERLYQLLIQAAKHSKYIYSSQLELEDVVNAFFEIKILQSNVNYEHIGGFYTIFNNFSSDLLLKQNAAKRGGGKLDSLDSKMEANPNLKTDQIDYDVNGEVVLNNESDLYAVDDLTSQVQFSGENQDIYTSANNWLEKLERGKEWWVTAYLGLHLCPSDGLALSSLNLRLHLESYHYKAKMLGITGPKKGSFWKSYHKTHIGKWMKELGIPVEEEPIKNETKNKMLICLKILCEVSLLRVRAPSYQQQMSLL